MCRLQSPFASEASICSPHHRKQCGPFWHLGPSGCGGKGWDWAVGFLPSSWLISDTELFSRKNNNGGQLEQKGLPTGTQPDSNVSHCHAFKPFLTLPSSCRGVRLGLRGFLQSHPRLLRFQLVLLLVFIRLLTMKNKSTPHSHPQAYSRRGDRHAN